MLVTNFDEASAVSIFGAAGCVGSGAIVALVMQVVRGGRTVGDYTDPYFSSKGTTSGNFNNEGQEMVEPQTWYNIL